MALVALRTPNLVRVEVDDDLLVMGMLADHRDELGRTRTQTVNRPHQLLMELFPAGPKQSLSAQQTRALIAMIKPRPVSRAFYDRKRAEGKSHKQALIALARRRINVLWAMLRDRTTYREPLPAA